MKKDLCVLIAGLMCCLSAWAAGPGCAAARREYNRLAPALQVDATGQPVLKDRGDVRRGVPLQRFLTDQIRLRLESRPAASAQAVQTWLRCVQQNALSPDRSNAPWAATLDASGNKMVVAEFIPLGIYGSLSRAWLQVWSKGPDRRWREALWIRPGPPYATFHAWLLRSPVADEVWFLESSETVSADGNGPTRISIVRWKQGQMQEAWKTPDDGVFHTRVVRVTPTRVVLRSAFGTYAHRERDLLRTFVVTSRGLEQTEARYVYFPSRPATAPLRPLHPVPLTEPDAHGNR